MDLSDTATPALILDRGKMETNLVGMERVSQRLGVPLRPHGKTPKCKPIAQRLMRGGAIGLSVSTLREAEEYFSAGVEDLFYAVGMVPNKLDRAMALMKAGARMSFLLDSAAAARAIADQLPAGAPPLPIVVEIDVDGYRTGINPADQELFELVGIFRDCDRMAFEGIMSYGGRSYELGEPSAVADLAEKHRQALVDTKHRLEGLGLECKTVSFGSTPAVLHARSMEGVTELRCGIYVFQDLFQAAIGCCRPDDIALSVLTTIIGIRESQNIIVVDAGSLAMSKDASTRGTEHDAGYGLVVSASGNEFQPGLYLETTNQEIGLVTSLSGQPLNFSRFSIGEQLRILPNHADLTAAAHELYLVVDGGHEIVDRWERFNFW
ncbi:MAG: alanine racemase [Xanthomonadales bacterium]|nr:alanine racemase [Xanthomonadales bacterium]